LTTSCTSLSCATDRRRLESTWDEARLERWLERAGARRTVGRTGDVTRERAEQGSPEVAVVAGDRCSLLRRHISCRSPLSTRSAFWRAPSGSTSPVRRNLPQIAPVVSRDEVPAKSALFRARCQLPQRLLKTVNRDDGQPVRVLAGSARIRADRHEEEIHMG